jgi:hypothetical protein
MNQTQAKLPNQLPTIVLERDSLKKDQNYVVLPAEELEDILAPGEQITLLTRAPGDGNTNWVADAVVTHYMTCYILDIPTFMLTGHHDPMMKNPMALYNALQNRLNRRLNPVDLVVVVGFRTIE